MRIDSGEVSAVVMGLAKDAVMGSSAGIFGYSPAKMVAENGTLG
jgi:hypothetical protein